MIGDVQQDVSPCARRRDGHDHRRRPRALHRQRALSARLRSDPQAIAREVLVSMPNGASIPLGQVAKVKLTQGPATIRTENAQLAAYIFVDARDRDLGGYVADARGRAAEKSSSRPATTPSGAASSSIYERAKARLKIVVPVTLLIICCCSISTSGA
jgi:Cu/Ag efflux pump CusA